MFRSDTNHKPEFVLAITTEALQINAKSSGQIH